MTETSYWSYGRTEYRAGSLIPDGRILIDTTQSFHYRESGLSGIVLGSRLTGLSPNLSARFTSGTLISAYEVYEALRCGIAIPFRKSDAECVRRFPELKAADRGGMMFQPVPGLYEQVHEIDFTSLYPSIIVAYNLSPETLAPPGQGFLPAVLGPLLELRKESKARKAQDPAYAGIDAILKWMLMTCFGYTGYKNAKFGHIEVHEQITGHAREILIRTKDIAEEMGFSVLHGIVDCLWVQGSPAAGMKARVEEETGLHATLDTYDWLVLSLPPGHGPHPLRRRAPRPGRPRELREKIGFVTQDTQLFSGSIRENLLFVRPGAGDAECLEVLEKAAWDSLLARADKGLDTLIGEGGVKVSGGEKQRLSIARALLRRPHLLVFDEATSSLDSLTEEEVARTIREVAADRHVMTVLIAHRLSTVMHSDRIHVLERGRIVEEGRHEELLAAKGLYYALWRQQVGERRLDPAPA